MIAVECVKLILLCLLIAGGEKVLATQLCVMFVKKCLEGVKSDKVRM